MPEKSGFFNAAYVNGSYDRVYNADSFADYFSSFISNGVFVGREQELLVTSVSPAARMAITILSGRAYIRGYWYQTTEPITLAVSPANSVNPRIDSVIVELSEAQRTIGLKVLTGTPAVNPEPPTLSNNQIQLATISIPVGKTAIINSDITDTRWDKTVCGAVGAIVNQIDTETFYDQVNELCRYYYGLAEGSYETYLTRLQDLISVMEQTVIAGDLSALQIEVANKLDAPYKNIASGFVYEDENDDVYLVPPNGLGGEVALLTEIDLISGDLPVSNFINVPVYRRTQKGIVFLEFEAETLLNNSSGPFSMAMTITVTASGQTGNSQTYPINFTWPQSVGNGIKMKNRYSFVFDFTKNAPGLQRINIQPALPIATNGSLTGLKCKVRAITLNHSTDTTSAVFTSDGKLVVTSNGQYISPRS